jgi:hypothetical protein
VPWKPFVAALLACGAWVAIAAPAPGAGLRAPPPAPADAHAGAVVDRVVEHPAQARRVRARAAQATGRTYATSDGQTVTVELSPAYAGDDAVARSHVAFLGGLLHGTELGRLTMRIVPAADVPAECGAEPDSGVLACYVPSLDLMIVPGEELEGDTGGVTTAYVIAHEYGHHIANHRSNAPFPSLDFGPKRWASEADVCVRMIEGRLAPGDEGERYTDNPGEAWAETYAQLRFGSVGWSFTELLRPTALSLAAARLDVTAPWTRSRIRTFRGTLGPADRRDTHQFRLALDGALSVQLRGPAGANYDLALASGGRVHRATRARGARDTLHIAAACVRQPEQMSVTVTRRSGRGPYTLRVRYAG